MENLKLDISSNLLDMDKTISSQDYIDKISILLKHILQKRFSDDYGKQQIVPHKDRITISCPICGDSMKSSYKKRGNIILAGEHANYYKCFNCGAFCRIDKFFKDFNINLDLDMVNYISTNLGSFNNNVRLNNKYDISLLINTTELDKYAFTREEIKSKLKLIEVTDSPIKNWLYGRLQFKNEKFLYNKEENYVLILNLTKTGKILGAQKRTFFGDNKYVTYNASKLHEIFNLEKVPTDIDVLSQLFGILDINFNLPITIFEGPFDAFLYNNSIGNTGANKKFPFDLPVRFWFDYDKTGIKKSIQYINEGKSVFLWNKFLRDVNLPSRKKYDLNDVMIFAKKEGTKLPLFDNYFSNNSLDIIDL